MKKQMIYVVLLAFSTVFCVNTTKIFKKRGNGNVTIKTITVKEYNSIKNIGQMDVILISGKEGEIKVETDDNLHEYVVVKVKGDELILRVKKGYELRPTKGINITIPFEVIDRVGLIGSGDVKNDDLIKVPNFTSNLVGSGDISLNIESTDIESKIIGSGNTILKGKSDNIEIKIVGSGDFEAYELMTNNANIIISGSGDVQIMVDEKLTAKINGSGDIFYKGKVKKIHTKISGSGNIVSKE